MADMQTALSISEIGSDGTHPTDDGYWLMASVWWAAFQEIVAVLQPPADNIDDTLAVNTNTCAKVAGVSRGPIQTQQGSGYDNGNYVHTSVAHGVFQAVVKGSDQVINNAIPAHIFFGQLVNSGGADRADALDEFIRIVHDDVTGINTYWFRLNNGGGNFDTAVTFDVDQDCDGGPSKSLPPTPRSGPYNTAATIAYGLLLRPKMC